MEKIQRVGLHNIKHNGTDFVNKGNNTLFDVATFSRLKHDDGQIAARWGSELAKKLIDIFGISYFKEDVVLASSAYNYTPTAAKALTDGVEARLSTELNMHSYRGVKRIRIHRVIPAIDYSGIDSAEKRVEALKSQKYAVKDPSEVAKQRVLVVDDIYMTGNTEKLV